MESSTSFSSLVFLSCDRKILSRGKRILTPPLASAIAMIAAASMTHERGFHIKPKNFKNLLSCKPKIQKTTRKRQNNQKPKEITN